MEPSFVKLFLFWRGFLIFFSLKEKLFNFIILYSKLSLLSIDHSILISLKFLFHGRKSNETSYITTETLNYDVTMWSRTIL